MSLVFQEVDSNRRRRRIIQFSLIVLIVFGGLLFHRVPREEASGVPARHDGVLTPWAIELARPRNVEDAPIGREQDW